jgi:hypothetical protein
MTPHRVTEHAGLLTALVSHPWPGQQLPSRTVGPWSWLPWSPRCFYFYCSGSTAEASNSKWLFLPRKIGRWQLQPPDRPHTKAAWRACLLTPAQGYRQPGAKRGQGCARQSQVPACPGRVALVKSLSASALIPCLWEPSGVVGASMR